MAGLSDRLNQYFSLKHTLNLTDANVASWIPQYAALVVGVVAQRFMQNYMTKGKWQWDGFGGWVLASVIIALMAFPGVYKAAFDTDKPLFVQLCVIFATGMGWQSLVGGALKLAGQSQE